MKIGIQPSTVNTNKTNANENLQHANKQFKYRQINKLLQNIINE